MMVSAVVRKKDRREFSFVRHADAELILPVKSSFDDRGETVHHDRLIIRVDDRAIDLPLNDVLAYLRESLGPRVNREETTNEYEQPTLH